MSNEILDKVREAEDLITQLKADVETRKSNLDREKEAAIKAYQDELQNELKKFELELDAADQSQISSATGDLDTQTSDLRQSMFQNYEQAKDELLQQGIKEVINKYGNFSHEESSNNRGASE